MNVRIPYNQTTDRISDPIAVRELHRQRLQRNQQRYGPHLAQQPDQKPLVEFLGEPSPELKLQDEENRGGNHEEIGVEGAETKRFEGQGQVVCWRCLKEVRGVDGRNLGLGRTMGIVHVKPMR